MTLVTGSRLGPYEILAAVGAGGMGEVYRAKDTRLDRAAICWPGPRTWAGQSPSCRRVSCASLSKETIESSIESAAKGSRF